MRKIGLVVAGLVLLATPVQVLAQVDGQVTKVDVAAGKITIKYGPFKKFDMDDPMTMVYPVQDPAMLKTVKPGNKVKFDADSVNGQIMVTKIQKTK